MRDPFPRRLDALDGLLDTAHPPVARLRIMSTGLAPNHTLKTADDLAGTAACVACGNCVDACPVVAEKPEGTMFVRTSMLLEHVVGPSCRRCFRCVAACPQVTRPLKDYVRAFRRVERTSHWLLLLSYLVLMTTGILVHHWDRQLPQDLRALLGVAHRACAVGLLLAPVLFLALDRRHLAMALGRSSSWAREDARWFRAAWRWLASFGRAGALERGAFNPGQRLWYLYVLAALAAFAATGVLQWLGPAIVGRGTIEVGRAVHVGVAYATDVLLLLHVGLKLGAPAVRDATRNGRLLLRYRERRARAAGGAA